MTTRSIHHSACFQSCVKTIAATLVVFLLLWPLGGAAQEPSAGVPFGDFNVQQSMEFGYRFTGINGNRALYDNYVDLHSGPRLLEQTLNMRSRTRKGALADDIFVSSFGYGGEPDTATRLQVSKDRWYEFTGMFRRDVNFFDYNLLANPLNPTNSYIQINDSPHTANLVRRMQDYSLVLAPQSRLRFRLSYGRNTNQGPSFTSFHEGTDVLLTQPFKTTTDSYGFGADYRLASRTVLSYDQLWENFRNDTYWYDNNFNFVLSDNTPVDAGLIYNPPFNQPCASPFSANPLGGPAILKATCNGYQSYQRTGAVRSLFPTEKLGFRSSYFKSLDLTASALYSSGDSHIDHYNESFLGLVTRTNERAFNFSGPTKTRRVLGNADFGGTYHITDKLAFNETFRYYNSRLPGSWLSDESAMFGALGGSSLLVAPGSFDPALCPPPYTAATCPKHTAGSGADLAATSYYNSQDYLLLMNTAEWLYDFSPRVGVHAGYRWTERHIEQAQSSFSDSLYFPPNPTRTASLTCTDVLSNGTCEVVSSTSALDVLDITQHAGLFGLWLRPLNSLRLNADVELASADGAVTRISPTNLQHFKFRTVWKPQRRATITANLNWLEQRNRRIATTFNGGSPDQDHLDHTRTFALSTMLLPNERFSLDLGFDWQDVFSHTTSCINLGVITVQAAFPACAFGPDSVLQNSIGQWRYQATVYGAHAYLVAKPIKHLTSTIGYDLTNSAGSSLYISIDDPSVNLQPNPLQPQGSLSYLWHKPSATLSYDLTNHWAAKGAWGFYDYNERGWQGPVLPRDFHAQTGTVSMRYSF